MILGLAHVPVLGDHDHLDGRHRSAAEEQGTLSLSLFGKDVFDSLKFLGSQRELRSLIVTIGLAILGGATIIPVGATT